MNPIPSQGDFEDRVVHALWGRDDRYGLVGHVAELAKQIERQEKRQLLLLRIVLVVGVLVTIHLIASGDQEGTVGRLLVSLFAHL